MLLLLFVTFAIFVVGRFSQTENLPYLPKA